MKIAVITGTDREGRRGERVAKWVMSELEKIGGAEFELLDLVDYKMPFYEESTSPDAIDGNFKSEAANRWREKISSADGFFIITAEYNHAPAAVLKNALDYVYSEWTNKPVAFISYAPGAAAGIRAVEILRLIVNELQMAVHIAHVLDSIDEDGNLLQGGYDKRLPVVLDQLLWWTKALKSARESN